MVKAGSRITHGNATVLQLKTFGYLWPPAKGTCVCFSWLRNKLKEGDCCLYDDCLLCLLVSFCFITSLMKHVQKCKLCNKALCEGEYFSPGGRWKEININCAACFCHFILFFKFFFINHYYFKSAIFVIFQWLFEWFQWGYIVTLAMQWRQMTGFTSESLIHSCNRFD